ncbi:hypothetical protein AL073_01700 [Loktanella sp. 1ANDIMAR09]|nr:hypothetical protein AL073_01700 [Loktanella sp. 1ANDIMAR09]
MPADRFEKVQVSSMAEPHDWLAAYHGQAGNIWPVTFKKRVPEEFASRADIANPQKSDQKGRGRHRV